jgi:hypothetical protein
MPTELIRYTEDFFSRNYPGTRIEKDTSYTRYITLSSEAQSYFRDFLKRKRYVVQSLDGNRAVLCNFDLSKIDTKPRKIIENIDINHPFIRWMRDVNSQMVFDTYRCSAIMVQSSELQNIQPGLYVYYIERWESEGYKTTNELKYYLYDVNRDNQVNMETSENVIITALNEGEDFDHPQYEINDFEKASEALSKCRCCANNEYSLFETRYEEDNLIICDKQQKYLKLTYERKKQGLEQQIQALQENKRSEKVITMTKGKLMRTEEALQLQLKKLQEKQKGRCTLEEIAVGLLKVVQ